MFREYEEISNFALIRNNLRHIDCEIQSDEPSMMRLAKECYQILLRIMVEALRGTANLAITGKRIKDKKHWFSQGDCPWMMIHKVAIKGCGKAWRYSEPVAEIPRKKGVNSDKEILNNFLLDFYDLLAMIQTPCFMIRYVGSAVVSVPDCEMKLLEWLHEEIRNEFEHFVPKKLLVASDDCLRASETCLRISTDLLTKSGNIMPFEVDELPAGIGVAFRAISDLRSRLNEG
jgi:hypothetical protein